MTEHRALCTAHSVCRAPRRRPVPSQGESALESALQRPGAPVGRRGRAGVEASSKRRGATRAMAVEDGGRADWAASNGRPSHAADTFAGSR